MVIISGLELSFRGSVVDALTVISPYFRFVYNAFNRHFPSIGHSLLTLQLHIIDCTVGKALRMRELCCVWSKWSVSCLFYIYINNNNNDNDNGNNEMSRDFQIESGYMWNMNISAIPAIIRALEQINKNEAKGIAIMPEDIKIHQMQKNSTSIAKRAFYHSKATIALRYMANIRSRVENVQTSYGTIE